ncbi:hypothetical protein C1645_346242 [Glomus cerebriforme]|uniref:Uncharacterized protein n=1 Tax=Glomus cerebriforme TaxID=658196 RepID=A0A397TK26_9GLOM|nr:hypothetical protein C1645_346242 [Glomus cerebriforme]
MLELPIVVDKGEETEKEPVTTSSNKPTKSTRSKQPAKKPILRSTSKKSAETIPKRRSSRKKNEDHEWHPDEADNELGDDSEVIPRGLHTTSKKTRKSPKKSTANKNVKSIDTIPEVKITKGSSNIKATPKTPKIPKPSRKGKTPVQSTRGRGRGRGGTARGSRSRNHDPEYRYSGEEETESEIEIANSTSEVVNTDDNSENQIVRESFDAEMDNIIQDEIEHNVAVVEEPVSTPVRPKRTRKSTKTLVSEPLDITPINGARAPVFVKPNSPGSTSLSSTPSLESQTQSSPISSSHATQDDDDIWSKNHCYHHLKKFYEETKNEYIRSGKDVVGNEDLYKEVAKKFYDYDTNNRIFGETN